MRHVTLILTLALASVLLNACNGSDRGNTRNPLAAQHYEGQWQLTGTTLEGTCTLEDVHFTVYHGEIFDAPALPNPVIDGAIIGYDFYATATYDSGEVHTFEGEMDGNLMAGEWHTDNETCFGIFEGRTVSPVL